MPTSDLSIAYLVLLFQNRLDELAQEKLFKFLKSDMALLQNNDSALQELILRLNTLSQDPGLAFLQSFIERLLNRIGTTI